MVSQLCLCRKGIRKGGLDDARISRRSSRLLQEAMSNILPDSLNTFCSKKSTKAANLLPQLIAYSRTLIKTEVDIYYSHVIYDTN